MSGEVTLFPDAPTILWSLINLIMLLAILAAIGFGIYSLVRMNRAVHQLNARIERLEREQK